MSINILISEKFKTEAYYCLAKGLLEGISVVLKSYKLAHYLSPALASQH